MRRSSAIAALLGLGCLLLAVPPPLAAQPVRLTLEAFGFPAEIEVRELRSDLGRAAAEAALAEIDALHRLTDPDSTAPGSLGALNAAAGDGPLAIDPRLAELLTRALQFCGWSAQAHGPLGGHLYKLWETQSETRRGIPPQDFQDALQAADCTRLSVRPGDDAAAELPAGSKADLRTLAIGFAIDRAAEVLAEKEVTNAWIEVGPVCRAIGSGPEGKGWHVAFPSFARMGAPPTPLLLIDQSMAMAIAPPGSPVPYIDHRTGQPTVGTVAVLAVTDLAVDAQALATTLFITGLTDGQRRLGTLNPRPAILWLLGSGEGAPLESAFNWSAVKKIRRRP